jgi:AAA family ATP:ADP antiporter
MVSRLRRFFDVRDGEGLPVLLAFLYIAVVVAAFLLAKPIRNSLFLRQYGPYSLVYVYAAVPLALSIFVPVYARIAARIGSRRVTAATLAFFSTNVLLFWWAFRRYPGMTAGEVADPSGVGPTAAWLLPGVFYVWVNCFGIIAPVQAWTFANSLFDTRQAKRLFGLVGAGASLGAIAGGLIARFLVGPAGGTVNMMLVLAALILLAAGIVLTANVRLRRARPAGVRPPLPRHPFLDSLRQIRASRYLATMASLVFLVAIATQWTAFQLSLVADQRFGGDADKLTAFFGTFNFTLGSLSFMLQLLLTGPLLRRFGVGATILLLPLSLAFGSALILAVPAFWTVLLTNGFDQGLRFSVDKATYELLYLPLPAAQRAAVKSTIDIVVNRVADAIGAILLGLATRGFLIIPGLGLGLRGTAAVNLALIGAWTTLAWRLRREYVRTIQDTIHRHRMDSEGIAAADVSRLATAAVRLKLAAADPEEVRYALDLVESQPPRKFFPALRTLLKHPAPDLRRRALAMLAAGGDQEVLEAATSMLRDRDIGVRTEALLYLSRVHGADPLRQIQELGDFDDFSIRAGMAAFLASPGPTQNLDAARAIMQEMASSPGRAGARERQETARLLARLPEWFHDLYAPLIADPETFVARQAIRSAGLAVSARTVPPLIAALGRSDVADDAAEALARYGNTILPEIAAKLQDSQVPAEVRRELPQVLVRIGTVDAEHLLMDSLLHADVTVRHNVVISLNKLHAVHPRIRHDPTIIELALAAEIAGHYRSYQVLGPLRGQLKEDDPVLQALHHAMEQELERIFRLMKLLFPGIALHDAYVGVRSSNPVVRANALEFLENVLKPELRQVLLPVLDSHVSVSERIALADRLVGAPLASTEQAVATLLASDDVWLRSCAVYAVGALQLHGLEPELRRIEKDADDRLKAAVRAARQRLAGESDPEQPQQPIPADMGLNVGAG